MPNTPVRAAAEGMPAINRRRALAVTGSGLAATLATMMIPKPASAATSESPCEAVARLARELSVAMDGWNADLGDTWVAHVHGASTQAYPIGFENVDARERATNAEIMTAFRQWDALYDQTYRKPAEDEDHMNRLCEAMWAIEKRAKALPATTPRALLAKFVMASTYGTYMLGDDADALFVEARAVLS